VSQSDANNKLLQHTYQAYLAAIVAFSDVLEAAALDVVDDDTSASNPIGWPPRSLRKYKPVKSMQHRKAAVNQPRGL
jgi:hypothetical protein